MTRRRGQDGSIETVVKREQRREKLSAEEIEKLIANEEQKWVHAVFVSVLQEG